jgi:curved DNA-binding protein CbpA
MPEWPSTASPTPHEILGIAPGAPYSKARFNQLVKMYHPDVSSTDPRVNKLPEGVRLERYRLIVAAHSLLGDSHSRRMYESHEGWFHAAPFERRSHATQETRPSPMRQHPIYTSNAAFAMLLVALGMLGAALQYRRLAVAGRDIKRLELILQEALQEEMQAWASVLHGQSRDDRILAFLARRHGVPHQLQNWVTAHGGPTDSS